jgi:hypothetical protein
MNCRERDIAMYLGSIEDKIRLEISEQIDELIGISQPLAGFDLDPRKKFESGSAGERIAKKFFCRSLQPAFPGIGLLIAPFPSDLGSARPQPPAMSQIQHFSNEADYPRILVLIERDDLFEFSCQIFPDLVVGDNR